MRTIERTGQFKRDYKREAKGPHRATLATDFVAVVKASATTGRWRQSITTML
jgi:mRNA interferase YafQ